MTYARKAQIIKEIFGKDVICIELQSEPWTSTPLMETPLKDQLASMNPQEFSKKILNLQKKQDWTNFICGE